MLSKRRSAGLSFFTDHRALKVNVSPTMQPAPAVDQRLGEIETAIEQLDDRPVIYDPGEIAIAGVFVTIDANGALKIDRGYVRPEDELPVEAAGDGDVADEDVDPDTGEIREPAIQHAVITLGGQRETVDEDDDDGIKPLPERLVTELTAHRTLALRDVIASPEHDASDAAGMPLEALLIMPAVAEGLRKLGFRTVGDLLDERRAVSRAGQADIAGCRYLHPSYRHHR